MSYRYPASAIVRDYVRGGVGATLFLTPVMAFNLPGVTIFICLVMGMLFVVHLGQTVIRHRMRIDMDDRAIRYREGGESIAWSDLNTVALRYFSVRRDHESGWLELRLGSGKRQLRLDSRMEGFEKITERAARAAAVNQLPLDSATLSNLDALGIQHSEFVGTRG